MIYTCYNLNNTWLCPWTLAVHNKYDVLMKPHEEIFKCFKLILVEIDEMSEYVHENCDYNLWYHKIDDYHV